MSYPLAAVLAALLAAGLLALMWWGWRGRVRRTGAHLAALPTVPAAGDGGAAPGYEGVYVSTTRAGDWLDRVAAQDLGVRSPLTASVRPDGVLLRRTGAQDVFVPAADLLAVRRDAGIAGKVMGRGGVVVLTWRLGEQDLDTGITLRRAADRDALVGSTQALLDSRRPASPADRPDPTTPKDSA